jgi:hypothetical protein
MDIPTIRTKRRRDPGEVQDAVWNHIEGPLRDRCLFTSKEINEELSHLNPYSIASALRSLCYEGVIDHKGRGMYAIRKVCERKEEEEKGKKQREEETSVMVETKTDSKHLLTIQILTTHPNNIINHITWLDTIIDEDSHIISTTCVSV